MLLIIIYDKIINVATILKKKEGFLMKYSHITNLFGLDIISEKIIDSTNMIVLLIDANLNKYILKEKMILRKC